MSNDGLIIENNYGSVCLDIHLAVSEHCLVPGLRNFVIEGLA